MREDEVVLVECGDGGRPLAGVVGVVEAGHAIDVEDVPLHEGAQATEQVNGGDHSAVFDAEFFGEGGHLGRVALTPEPDLGGGVESGLAADQVDGVIGEEFGGLLHDPAEDVRTFAFWEVFGGGEIGDFVGWGGGDIKGLVATVDEEVAVGDAGVEFEAGDIEGLREIVDEAMSFGVGDSACGVVFHDAVGDGDKVAAEDPVGGRQGDALGGGFEGSAAGVVFSGVVAEEAHDGDIGAGLEAIGDGSDGSLSAGDGDLVHIGDVGDFEGRSAAEFLEGVVAGTVGDDDGVFHDCSW